MFSFKKIYLKQVLNYFGANMRYILVFFILFFLVTNINAQIDSKKSSGIIIPAIEAPKDSLDSQKIKPILPKQDDFKSNNPKIVGALNLPKKEFSMFPQEKFGNPGELFKKKLERQQKALLPEGHGENAGIKEDAYWGDYRTTSKSVQISYRDHSAIDGDIIRVIVNDDILQSRVVLSSGYSGFNLPLAEGLNKIEFYAVNTGASGPNTAEYIIFDDKKDIITRKIWGLAAGVKVTVFIIKE